MKTTRKSEPPCLSLIDTEILDNQMHFTCYFRSWDAYGGLPANIAGLQLFNEAFVNEINDRGHLSLKTGKLIFHSKNCHIYQRQYNLVKELFEPKDGSKRMSASFTVNKPERKYSGLRLLLFLLGSQGLSKQSYRRACC